MARREANRASFISASSSSDSLVSSFTEKSSFFLTATDLLIFGRKLRVGGFLLANLGETSRLDKPDAPSLKPLNCMYSRRSSIEGLRV